MAIGLSEDVPVIMISGITALQLRQIEASVGRGAMSPVKPSRTATAHPELLSTIVVLAAVSIPLLKALAALASSGKVTNENVIEFEHTTKDGDKTVVKLRNINIARDAPKVEVVNAFATALNLDLAGLKGLDLSDN